MMVALWTPMSYMPCLGLSAQEAAYWGQIQKICPWPEQQCPQVSLPALLSQPGHEGSMCAECTRMMDGQRAVEMSQSWLQSCGVQ